ncbi:hypothetical protein ACLOJK_004789 [Asimina triloba]
MANPSRTHAASHHPSRSGRNQEAPKISTDLGGGRPSNHVIEFGQSSPSSSKHQRANCITQSAWHNNSLLLRSHPTAIRMAQQLIGRPSSYAIQYYAIRSGQDEFNTINKGGEKERGDHFWRRFRSELEAGIKASLRETELQRRGV